MFKVSLGWGHAVALTAEGQLFGWGYYADGRLGQIGAQLEVSPLDSVTLSSGNIHLMMEAAEKLVSEAIEKEKDMPIIWEPTLIKDVQDVEVFDIACGLDHSLILCSDGILLSGGSNVYGQLGRGKNDVGFYGVDIRQLPVSIACGLGHCLAICEDRKSVVTWGWNQSCQLGRVGPENVPGVVETLVGERAVCVCGGRAHSIAVMSNNDVWSWGCGRNGRLGLGSSVDESEPMLIQELVGYQVLETVAGFDHSLVLVAK